MARNHFNKRYITLEQAVDEVVNSTGSDEDDIIILPPKQGDSYATDIKEEEDICHKNDKLPNDVVGFLEVHEKNSDENEVDSDISETVQIEETSKHLPNKKKRKKALL